MIKYAVIIVRTFIITPSIATRLQRLISYFSDLMRYRRLQQNTTYSLNVTDLFPRIHDKTPNQYIDPIYFLQGCWCARKIFEARPAYHYDVASQAIMVGIVSQFTPTTMIDIRPLSLSLPGLSFIRGDVTNLPFKDREIHSLSSICVIEHIGLGRYGDELDPFGTEKAARELSRVLAPHGSLYISVPVDKENKIYFNAHRAFTRDYIINLFQDFSLIEERYIYGRDMCDAYDVTKGFGTGLYHFKKR